MGRHRGEALRDVRTSCNLGAMPRPRGLFLRTRAAGAIAELSSGSATNADGVDRFNGVARRVGLLEPTLNDEVQAAAPAEGLTEMDGQAEPDLSLASSPPRSPQAIRLKLKCFLAQGFGSGKRLPGCIR